LRQILIGATIQEALFDLSRCWRDFNQDDYWNLLIQKTNAHQLVQMMSDFFLLMWGLDRLLESADLEESLSLIQSRS